MAQLHARGALALDTPFVHESVIGTRFTGLVGETEVDGRPAVIPEITGRADHRDGPVPARPVRPVPRRLLPLGPCGSWSGAPGSSARRPRGARAPRRRRRPARRRRGVGRHDRARRGQRAVRGQGRRGRAAPGSSAARPTTRSRRRTGRARGSAARARWSSTAPRRGWPPSLRGSSGCARRASSASCSAPRRRALEPGLGELLGATWVPGDLQCDPRAIARAMAEEDGIRVHTHTRVDRLVPGEGVVVAGEPEAPTTSCSPPAVERQPARTAGLHLPLEPRKGQLVRSRDGSTSAARWSTAATSPPSGPPEAGLQVSTVVETTADGQARRLEPRAQGLRHERRPGRH